jgi:hypothetical protein
MPFRTVLMLPDPKKTKTRWINLTPMQLAMLAPGFIIPLSAAFAADEVHDEIQVYNAEIAGVGQWIYEQHLNYTGIGQNQPEVPGGFSSNHALQGTPEFAYGLTDWWEAGFYLPFAVSGDGQFLSDGAKIRSLFVVPDAAKRSFFYGINFELGYELPRFSSVPWNLEIRPIIGVRNKEWEFIINPIVDVGFGSNGEADFAPAVRLARNLGEDRFIGLEYYADFGKIGSFLPLQHVLIFLKFQDRFASPNLREKGFGVEPLADELPHRSLHCSDEPARLAL